MKDMEIGEFTPYYWAKNNWRTSQSRSPKFDEFSLKYDRQEEELLKEIENVHKRKKLSFQVICNIETLKGLSDLEVRLSNLSTEIPKEILAKFEEVEKYAILPLTESLKKYGFPTTNSIHLLISKVESKFREIVWRIESRNFTEEEYENLLSSSAKEFTESCFTKYGVVDEKKEFYGFTGISKDSKIVEYIESRIRSQQRALKD
ncbi:MAG: hypothetical protein KKC19_04230 [Nanoarchaeota archaeon]|nr:hypothetical protein [Nanoarchaeota archaeon]